MGKRIKKKNFGFRKEEKKEKERKSSLSLCGFAELFSTYFIKLLLFRQAQNIYR